MAEELIDRCTKLKITYDEGSIIDLGNDVSPEMDDKLSLRLVGKLLTSRAFNIEAFKRTMIQSWGVQQKVVIKAIETNLFVFQFFHWRDKDKVLAGCPWCFDQQLLILNEITGNEQPADVSLSYSPFWVRIHNLPFNCRSTEDVKTIASAMGAVMETENDELGLEKFCRVRVLVDVNKPLRRFQKIKNKNNTVVTIEFKYERLPFFCFMCGRMGHHEKDCQEAVDNEGEKELGWGLWLKASPRKGRSQYLADADLLLKGQKRLFVRKGVSEDSSSPGLPKATVTINLLNSAQEKDIGGKGDIGCEGVEDSHGGIIVGVVNEGNAVVGEQVRERVTARSDEEGERSGMIGAVGEKYSGQEAGSAMDAGHDLSTPLWTFSMGCASSTKPHKLKKMRRVSRKVHEVPQVDKIGPRGEKRKECDGNEVDNGEVEGGLGKRVCRDLVLEDHVDMDESYGSLTVAEVGQIQPREEQ